MDLRAQLGSALFLSAVAAFLPAAVPAQEGSATITGTVRGSDHLPVPGVVVELEPSGLSAVTDREGRYLLELSPSRTTGGAAVLRAASVGHRTQERTLSLTPGRHDVDFLLAEQVVALDEVLVTGTAGRRERRAQAAVVASVDAAALGRTAPVATVANLLQGRVAGVTVQQRSGSTGTGQTIRIRGRASVALGNDPLLFIDGVRMDSRTREFFYVGGQAGSRLNDLRVEDVQRIEVVKGPAAATLFGADASAGVVQIFTKRGRPETGFSHSLTVEHGRLDPRFRPPGNWGVCERRHIEEGAPLCHGVEPGTAVWDNPLERVGLPRPGSRSAASWAMRGGGDRFAVFTSFGMDRERGTLPNNEMERISGRLNLDLLTSDELRFELGLGLGRSRVRLPHNDNNILGYLGGGLLGSPLTLGVTASDGWFAGNRQLEAISRIETFDTSLRMQPRLSVEYQPLPWLRSRLTLGGDLTRSEARSFFPLNDRGWYPDEERNSGRITQLRENRDQLTLDYLGTVSWAPRSWLGVDQSFGVQVQTLQTDVTSATGSGLASNRVRGVDAAARRTGGQSFYEERQAGAFGQLQLTFEDRLYLQGAVRVDRHSAFGAEAEPFYSPRVGVSWVASEEPTLRRWLPRGWVEDVRIRAVYGATGRSPSSGSRATFVPEPFAFVPDRVGIGVVPRSPGNPELRPERGSELEGGFDASLLGGRVGLEATYFRKRTRDLILERALPPSLGFSHNPLVNLGRVSNWGYEIVADLRLAEGPEFSWDLRLGLHTLTNRVVDMGDVPPFGERNWVIPGGPILGYYGYRVREVDVERGVTIVSNEMEFLGNPPELPGREALVQSTVNLPAGLSLHVQLDYRGDVHLFNRTDEWRERVQAVGERWVRRDLLPAEERHFRFGPYFTENGVSVPPDLVWDPYVEPADFLRLREAALTARLPPPFVRRFLRGEGATVTLTGRNLATWTRSGFHGLDPESSYNAVEQFFTMPPERRLLLRLRVEF